MLFERQLELPREGGPPRIGNAVEKFERTGARLKELGLDREVARLEVAIPRGSVARLEPAYAVRGDLVISTVTGRPVRDRTLGMVIHIVEVD